MSHVYGPIFSEVSRLTTFAYLHSTLSRDSRQALIPPIGTLPRQQGAMASTIDVIRKKMDTHPFAKRVPVQFIKGNFKERHLT
jgi:hypothetical protein